MSVIFSYEKGLWQAAELVPLGFLSALGTETGTMGTLVILLCSGHLS